MIAQLSDAGVRWHEYVRLARLHRRLWGQMLLWALRHGHDAVAAGLSNQLPSLVSFHIWSNGIGIKLGLTKRAGCGGAGWARVGVGTSHHVWRQKAWRSAVRLGLPVLFKMMLGVGGLRGSWQRQMAEQSAGHRMQLLHINRFLITVRMTASFSFEQVGLLEGMNTASSKSHTEIWKLRLIKTLRT